MKKQPSEPQQQSQSAFTSIHYEYFLIGSKSTDIDLLGDTKLATFHSVRDAMAEGSARSVDGWVALAVTTPWSADEVTACAVGLVADGQVRWVRLDGYWILD